MELSEFFELYNPKLFQDSNNSFCLNESQDDAKVKGATIQLTDASFKYVGEDIWKSSCDLYNKSCSDHNFQFRKRCDGFTFCQYRGKKYIIWIELKSGFNEVFNKAIYQLSACYIKMQSYLNAISTYNAGEYEEIAIVVSRPEGDLSNSGNNNMIQSRRQALVNTNESAEDKCRRRYRETGIITIDDNDFCNGILHLDSNILPHSLKCYHIATMEECPTIDLASIITA